MSAADAQPASHGLPPAARLRSRAQFDAVFADAKSVGDRNLRVLGRRNRLTEARLGLIVSRRVDKRATVRNQIKRIIRESFRVRRTNLAGWDLVVLCKTGAGRLDRRSLRTAMDRLWDQFAGRYGEAA